MLTFECICIYIYIYIYVFYLYPCRSDSNQDKEADMDAMQRSLLWMAEETDMPDGVIPLLMSLANQRLSQLSGLPQQDESAPMMSKSLYSLLYQ